MKYDKIMAEENLDNIMGRLNGCRAVFDVIHANMASGENCADAFYRACDFLESICRDLQADIDAAEDYIEGQRG